MILKAESLPRIRDRVVDEKLEPVGTVFDIFGPVSSPYVSVKTEMDDLHRLVNRVLYSIPSSKSRKMKRRRRK